MTAATSRGRGARVAVGIAAFLVLLGLLGLGLWQVQRRAWKHDLVAQVNARVAAAPVAMPGPAAWPKVTVAGDAYRHVTARGYFIGGKETFVQAVTEVGAGFWVMTPFRTDLGFTVLVNRGFVPPELRRAAAPAATTDLVAVTGLLRVTEPGGAFLRSNDPIADRWYSRDVAAIATARGLGDVAPYFVDADATANPQGYPVGGLTVVAFSDNHLVYALTWFGLAAMLAGAIAWAIRDDFRARSRTA